MKGILKLLSALTLLSMFFTGTAVASTGTNNVTTNNESAKLWGNINESVTINNLKDANTIIQPECIACINRTVKVTKLKSYGEEYRFVKYLTNSWSPASTYTWSESTTTNLTVSGSVTAEIKNAIKTQLGLTASKTQTYGVGITIPANSSKDSKLALYSDFNKYYVKYEEKMGGKVIKSSNHYVYEPTSDTYLRVKYK